ncbi:MAG: hypothetical protein K0R54_5423 [Clostridiaceae bacterium]|jgi:hypothetical protein|nr:hypothetical protein [Clostridiaceae bacterium]
MLLLLKLLKNNFLEIDDAISNFKVIIIRKNRVVFDKSDNLMIKLSCHLNCEK